MVVGQVVRSVQHSSNLIVGEVDKTLWGRFGVYLVLTFHTPGVIIPKRIEQRSRQSEDAARPLPTRFAFRDFPTRLEAAL